MKYTPLSSELYITNRLKFTSQLKSNSIAVFNSNDIMPTSADGTRSFVQHTDILYLSGINQEESILLLFPDAPLEKDREILFLKETSELIAVWEGHKYTKEEATSTSGIKSIYWINEFERIFFQLMCSAENVYLNTNEHFRASTYTQTSDQRFIEWCKQKFPLHTYNRSATILHKIRAIKSQIEIDTIAQACQITKKAFERVLKFVEPGVMEYEIEAEIMHEFIRNRSQGPAYESIIASGKSACVLHYIENNRRCNDGDLILMDFGAEYANYASDLSRTIPVNGKFTDRQKDVYLAVHDVMKFAYTLLRPGNNLADYHKEVGSYMSSKLVDLKLLDSTDIKNQSADYPAYKKYFMHGTSHHLGLNVHDYGNPYLAFEENMVFTCEPGIYIPNENLGIRLENDIVILKDSILDLMGDIPIELEEIESIMNDKYNLISK